MNLKEIKKIAVLKGPGVGDVITSIPLLRNLRKNFSKSEIIVFNEISYGVGKEILRKCPYIDHIIEINQKSVFSILKIIRKIRKEKFDIIVDSFPSTWKTAIFCYLSGAKFRLGYYHNPLSFLYNVKVKYKNQNKVELEANLLEKLGLHISEKDKELELFFDLKKNEKKINELLRKNRIRKSDILIGIHAGRTDDIVRTWVDERWAKLCDILIEKYKAKIIFVGGKSDEKRVEDIVRLMKNKPINFVNLLNLEETATLIKKMKLFLCINGGPMHIAAALKKPLIALCGDTKLGWDPYGKNSYVIRKNFDNFRDTNYKKGNNYYMRLIDVDDVLNNVIKVLRNN
ncbi:MAG: glycosyltransferase family 9 protein [Candidatus Aenigmatarchaeota archaeon]